MEEPHALGLSSHGLLWEDGAMEADSLHTTAKSWFGSLKAQNRYEQSKGRGYVDLCS